MKILHHNDADGRFAAFLVARCFRDSLSREDLIEIDYVKPIPIDKIQKGELVFIVDFSFSGKLFDIFKEIVNRSGHVVWIDHHADFLKMEEEYPWTAEIPGIRRANIVSNDKKKIKFSGAALTMVYMDMLNSVLKATMDFGNQTTEQLVIHLLSIGAVCKNKDFSDTAFTFDTHPSNMDRNMAEKVEWVSDYDTFSRSESHRKFEEFYYGISDVDQNPWDGQAWFLSMDAILDRGDKIKRIVDSQNKNYLERVGMVCSTQLGNEEIRILAVNKEGNSFVFNSVPDIEHTFPVRMLFRIVDTTHVKVTFFSDEGHRALARELAVHFGGGGHPQAAGCTIPMYEWNTVFTYIRSYSDWLSDYINGREVSNSKATYEKALATRGCKRNETGIWDIWMEGYHIQGEIGKAHLLATIAGYGSFGAACEAAKEKLNIGIDIKYDADSDTYSYWGCRLFDNEKDARLSFG